MANTYTKILYHITFSTKDRVRAINAERRDELFAYIWGINKDLKCHLYRVGGIEDHIHILTEIAPNISLADYVEKVKSGSTNWIQRESVFQQWPKWQSGYAAFTESWESKDRVIDYISNQVEHHRTVTFEEEYQRLVGEAGIKFDEAYLF